MTDIWYESLKRGVIKYNRLPGKLKIWSLEKYLTRRRNYTTICTEIKYSVNTPSHLRDSELWFLIKNSFPNSYNFDKICAFKTHNFKNNIDCIILIDFSILYSNNKEIIKLQYPEFYTKLVNILRG